MKTPYHFRSLLTFDEPFYIVTFTRCRSMASCNQNFLSLTKFHCHLQSQVLSLCYRLSNVLYIFQVTLFITEETLNHGYTCCTTCRNLFPWTFSLRFTTFALCRFDLTFNVMKEQSKGWFQTITMDSQVSL
jgi:hypothetical protein